MTTIKNKIQKENEKKNKMTLSKWWNKNGYKIIRVILWPAWLFVVIKEKCHKKAYSELVFTNSTCKKYIDAVMPEMVRRHNNLHEEILISNADDMGAIEFVHFYHSKNKKANTYFLKFFNEVKEYILTEYVIDGYDKMIIDNYTHWYEAQRRFNWDSTPNSKDFAKGVIFYESLEEKK